MSEPALITIASRHQVYLEGLKTREANKVLDFLKSVNSNVSKKLMRSDLTDFTKSRLERLIVSIRKDINKLSEGFLKSIELEEIAKYEAEFEVKSLGQVYEAAWAVPTTNQLMKAALTNPLSAPGIDGGGLLNPFMKSISTKAQGKIAQAIRSGFYQGETNNQILQKIRGTRKAGYRDGIISSIDTDTKTVVRTAIQHVAQQARQEVWNKNSDIVKKVRITATLDSKTSQVCQGLDGRVFEVSKGPRPPFHPNCRTTTAAVLDGRFAQLSDGATRRSRDHDGDVNYVPRNQSYYGWLKTQPAKFQDSVIGPTRGKLLRNGGLTAQRFQELQLGKNFRPLTLDQMRELDPIAFEKANI